MEVTWGSRHQVGNFYACSPLMLNTSFFPKTPLTATSPLGIATNMEVNLPFFFCARLPLQATAGSQRLELMVPNLGTKGYHCKELPVPKGWNWWFPTWEPKVTMARNCRFPGLETYGSQPGNQRLPLQGIAGSQKLEFMFSKLSGYHCKELRVPKAWNSWFQAWKRNVTSGRICWLQKVRTHGS